MIGVRLIILVILSLGSSIACAADSQPFGLETRVPFTTNKVIGAPTPPPPFRLVQVLPEKSFSYPVHVIAEPGGQRLLVIEYHGKIWAIYPNDLKRKPDLFLELPRDAYGLTFHPRFAENGLVYVFGHTSNDAKPKNIISRFHVGNESPRKCEPKSEVEIISWESAGHDGGELAFGPKDGMLYISAGDSTTDSDPKETGQDLSDLCSAMIRIDVDHPAPGKMYAIPPDNPFINLAGARPEIWAYGFRNPWRFCFDASNGRLWMGDIGQDLWEMIEIVERGSNHGWSVKEGPADFLPKRPKRGPTPIKPPIVSHQHVEARSITGGFVYVGDRFPELRGAYIYGDYATGRMWSLRYENNAVTDHHEIADSSVAMLGLCNDASGDVWTLDYATGALYRLEPQSKSAVATHKFPRRLSETGLYASVRDHEFAPGVIPFAVNSPLWSDGARKERAFALPGNSKIEFSPNLDATWGMPEGAILLKTFCLPAGGRSQCETRVETRLLVLRDKEWEGYSYVWNDDQSDAMLVDKNGMDKTYACVDPLTQKTMRSQTWHFPSRAECMVCHSRAAGFALGMKTGQLNRNYDYGGTIDNQLRAYDHIGLFEKKLDKAPEAYPRLPDPHDDDHPIEARARSYLHTNCSICHVEAGGGNARFQLSFHLTDKDLNLIDHPPQHHDFGLPNPKLVAPGKPESSVLLHRVSTRGQGKMPPLATSVVDEKAVKLIHEWIKSKPQK